MARIAEGFATRVAGLTRKDGRLWLERPGGEAPVAVTVRYLRPLSGRTEIVLLDGNQREVVTALGVDAFTGEERLLVEEALRERYHLAAIRRVLSVDVRFGTRYWKVDTDRGPRWFALREPGKNVTWLSERHLVLRDTAGNRFEIPDLDALDGRSRRAVERSL
jgi:hypothetical protein